ncbi:MAG: MBL fold metallo-hydrolase [Candidatus Harrisonbacteria bacterium]|nr:MBL fold metallo-hydrolase [Candidatus Harrisonbacteria bacterium]
MEKVVQEDKFKYLRISLGLLITLDILIWVSILFPVRRLAEKNLELYFLDVGQGDSSFIRLVGGVDLLIDGGPPNGRLEKNLEKILPIQDRYIDLVMVSHPQLDHFGGLIEVLKNYKIGAVLTSNQISKQAAWQELEKIIKEKGIRRIILAAGDKIKYQNSQLDILSPRTSDWAKDINDLSLVALLQYPYILENVRVLFTGDISGKKEKELADLYDLDVDILKVSHHGSRFSSDSAFLEEASPAVSVIEVGKNSYGHPTSQALARLANFSSQVYRTDNDGLVKLLIDGGKLRVYAAKQ